MQEVCPALFLLSGDEDAPCHAYYVQRDDPVSPDEAPFSVQDIWEAADPVGSGSARYYGWFVFLATPVAAHDGPAFVRHARAALPELKDRNWHGIAWMASPWDTAATVIVVQWNGVGRFATAGPAPFNFGTFALTISYSSVATINLEDGTCFLIAADSPSSSIIRISYAGVPQPVSLPDNQWRITVPIDGSQNGSLGCNVALDIGQLAASYGCLLRYGYGEPATSLDCPVFPPQALQPGRIVAFDILLNPIRPLHPDSTRLAFDFSGAIAPIYSKNARAITTAWLATPAGANLVLAPEARANLVLAPEAMDGITSPIVSPGEDTLPAGFAFCRNPSEDAWRGESFYLAPAGRFVLSDPSFASPDNTVIRLMPGLFMHEFLALHAGDTILFEPDAPAWAPGFEPRGSPPAGSSPDGTGSARLTDRSTTSWLRVVAPDTATRPYYSQPSESCYYAAAAGQFPMVCDPRLGDAAQAPAFPMILFNGLPAAEPAFSDFEAAVLAPERHRVLADLAEGPIFGPPPGLGLLVPAPRSGRRRTQTATAPPAAAVTPQGLLVETHADGTWRSLLLARSTAADGGELTLAIDAATPSGRMDPRLSSLFTADQLFLVITKLDPEFAVFRNEIAVGGFAMRISLDPTLLIFKFNNRQPLTTLARTPSLWAGSDFLVAETETALAAIEAAFAMAQDDGEDGVFTTFNQLVSDPGWTGIIALGVEIDGNAMPLDLQILLGGIDCELRAHHVGIDLTHVGQGASPDQPALGPSSLFGVIAYDAPPTSPPASVRQTLDYAIERLDVVFLNSKVTVFDAQIGLTINSLFGRQLTLRGASPVLPVSANTMLIRGQYQSSGGVGVVSFATHNPFELDVLPAAPGASQVLDRITVSSAALVPISTEPLSPAGHHVIAEFQLNGELWFRPDPFPGRDGLDLFSYGVAGTGGLAVSALTIRVQFELDGGGAILPGSRSIAFAPSSLLPTVTGSGTIRRNSLMYSLPLRLSGFAYSAEGLTASTTGATAVQVLELESANTPAGSPSGSPDEVGNPASSPYTTAAPLYALEYELSLGSLGSLSDFHGSITAKLLLAWGPSPLTPDDDAAAVLVQLPQLGGGYGSLELQGFLKMVFGDANLLRVVLDDGSVVYAILFNNVALSVFGFTFPPGVMMDFMLFAGSPTDGTPGNENNLAWFVSAQQTGA